jgi:methanethiol S-methyltransferase
VVTWSGALLFLASLGYALYTFTVTFARVAPGPPAGRAITWNVTLFTIFALHHTIFARTPVRAWVARRMPALERSFYVWIASVLFILVCRSWKPVGGLAWDVDGLARWLLLAAQGAGIVLTIWGAAALDFRELAGMRGVNGVMEFKTAGPYGWVRHPIYAGWFLVVLAATPMTMTRLVFAVVSCAYLIVAIPFEEGTLRRASDGAYAGYVEKVRWKLFPGVY